MSGSTPETSALRTVTQAERRRVLAATIVGTTVEWYDFFIYAYATATIFNTQFFGPMASSLGDGGATLISVATIGLSFLFRPLGAFIAGHLGDRIGRKPVLILTLVTMGVATALIGLLPTGGAAPVSAVILLLLRILQGLSTGGEWGGAALMAVETAQDGHRNRAGAWPQLGVPAGMLLANGMILILQRTMGNDGYVNGGWRISFLFSVVLIIVGYLVRRAVDESPVFKQMEQLAKTESAPIVVVFKKYWLVVILAALVFAGDNAVGYMLVGPTARLYATNPDVAGLDPVQISAFMNIAAVAWGIFTYLGSWLADKYTAKLVFIIGYVLMAIISFMLFPVIRMAAENPSLFLVITCALGLPLGFCYGPLSAWYAEVFPASVRYSGVSITYAIGAVLGGAFAPLITQALFEASNFDWVGSSLYLAGMSIVGLIGSIFLRNRHGIPLGHAIEDSGEWEHWRPSKPLVGTR